MGGVYVYGVVVSSDDDITTPLGGFDAWLISLDEDLNLLWERTLGGSNNDTGISMCFAPDGGLVLAGNSSSSDGDLTGNFGGGDLWVVKFNPEEVGIAEAGSMPSSLSVTPNPASDRVMAQWPNLDATRIEVFDARGRMIYQKELLPSVQRQLEIPAQSWDQGLYTVCLRTATDRVTQRFIKQ